MFPLDLVRRTHATTSSPLAALGYMIAKSHSRGRPTFLVIATGYGPEDRQFETFHPMKEAVGWAEKEGLACFGGEAKAISIYDVPGAQDGRDAIAIIKEKKIGPIRVLHRPMTPERRRQVEIKEADKLLRSIGL